MSSMPMPRGPTGRGAPPRALRVLVVEDEAILALDLQDMVGELGDRVLGLAKDPAEAEQAAERLRPDLALMDIRLAGGASGIEAARRLWERWGIRCIFVSANLDAGTRARLAAFHPLGFVAKPFSQRRLREALDAARQALGRA